MQTDVLIIGAGVIGLAIAKELSVKERDIIVLEKNKSFGQETSSHNSEVIHAGMYYPSGTLKAEMCVEGRHLLYELCQKKNIPHKKIGKLIVAIEKEQTGDLEKLFIQGKNNGVDELKIVGGRELKGLEPNIVGISALYSPQTGIIDSHRLMQYFLESARNNDAIVAFNSEVTAIKKLTDGYKVSVQNGIEETILKAQIVINCAGLDSDIIAQMVGINIKKCKYELHYCKGQYFRVNSSKSSFIQRLLYPVPKPRSGGLGIHATLDLAGGLRLGPDDKYLESRIKDYSVDETRRIDFYDSVKRFMPFLEENELQTDMAGIRPKLQIKDETFRDFIIKEETDNGLPGFINLIGIESPGLTASLAIGKRIVKLAKNG